MGLPFVDIILDRSASAAYPVRRGADIQSAHHGTQGVAGGSSCCKHDASPAFAILFIDPLCSPSKRLMARPAGLKLVHGQWAMTLLEVCLYS